MAVLSSSAESDHLIGQSTVNRLSKLYPIAFGPAAFEEQSTCKKIIHAVARLFLSVICYSATYSSLESARRNFDSKFWQDVFAYGDAFAWGTLTTWSAFNIYKDMVLTPRFNTKSKNRCIFATHWIAVIALSIFSELPTVYTSYYYNENLFWAIYTPMILAFFAMLSTHEFFWKMCVPHNGVSRCVCPKSKDIPLSLAQHHFYKITKNCHQSLSQCENSDFFSDLRGAEPVDEEGRDLLIKVFLLKVLLVGIQYQELKKKSQRCDCLNGSIRILAGSAAIVSPALDSYLIYKGYSLILKTIWPLPFIIFFAVAPGIYLQVKMNQQFYGRLHNKALTLPIENPCSTVDKAKKTLQFSCKWILIVTFTILGLASDTTIARDNLGFNTILGSILSCIYISIMAVILITSLGSMGDDLTHVIKNRYRSVTKIAYDNSVARVESISEFFKQASLKKFREICNSLGLQREDLQDLANDELQECKIQELLDSHISTQKLVINTTSSQTSNSSDEIPIEELNYSGSSSSKESTDNLK